MSANSTLEVGAIDMQMVIEYLHKNLRLSAKTVSHYVGDMHGGESLYKDSYEISLLLDGEVIDAIDL